MSDKKINIDQALEIGANLISDSVPKTKAGVFLRWVKKLIKIKSNLGINIKK